MTRVALQVNGEPLETEIEPRTHLADFLREHCHLTGTHIGCEHGVCGACTVLIDGAPARSCITYAVACEGSAVRTVEGFPDDPLMQRLREAFHREHALQCGYCTPGMLVAAYDLVRRRPGIGEADIRTELAGNLCRCTGYVGIVRAIQRVMSEAPAPADAPRPPAVRRAAPSGPLPRFTPVTAAAAPRPAPAAATTQPEAPPAGWTRVSEAFTIDCPPAELWAMLGDVERMGACMPGAVLDGCEGRVLRGRLKVRMGPIHTAFAGTATLERDDRRLEGRLTGGGGDAQASSRADGTVVYRLLPDRGGDATRVSVSMDFKLQGALAQFGRSGIVRDLIARTVAEFAGNIARLAGGGALDDAAARHEIDAGHLVAASLWARLKAWWTALIGR